MSTKANPSEFCPFAKLSDDVPYFCLTANDPEFETMLHMWAMLHRKQLRMGLISTEKIEKEERKIKSALDCATEGAIWLLAKQTQEEAARYTFNTDGNATHKDGVLLQRGKKGS